jgi:hypothetical protein
MSVFMGEYELGEIVYLKTDTEQTRRMVAGVEFCLSGAVLYCLLCGTEESGPGHACEDRGHCMTPERRAILDALWRTLARAGSGK